MMAKVWPLVGCVLLCACAPRSNVHNGTVLLDEDIALTPTADHPAGAGSRELKVPGDATLVAFVEEHGTDVTLTLRASEPTPAHSIRVENRLRGHGIEIAVLDVDSPSQVMVNLA